MARFSGKGTQKSFLRKIIRRLARESEPPEIAFQSHLMRQICLKDR